MKTTKSPAPTVRTGTQSRRSGRSVHRDGDASLLVPGFDGSQIPVRSTAVPASTPPVQMVLGPAELNEEYNHMTSGGMPAATMRDKTVTQPDFGGQVAADPAAQGRLADHVYGQQTGGEESRAIGRFGPGRDHAMRKDPRAVLNAPAVEQGGQKQSGWNHALNALFIQGGIDQGQAFHVWGGLTAAEQQHVARAKDFSSIHQGLQKKMKKASAAKKAQRRHPNLASNFGASITTGELMQLKNAGYHTGTVVGESPLVANQDPGGPSHHGHSEAHPSLRGLAEAQREGAMGVFSGSVMPEIRQRAAQKPGGVRENPAPEHQRRGVLRDAHVGELDDDMLGDGSGIGRHH